LEQAAALAAEQRALAEEKLAKAAEERRRADEAAATAAEKRIGNEARAAGVDPKTQIALSRAQEMLGQLQKERTALQAERDEALEQLKRVQAALAEKESAHEQALAELKRMQAARPAAKPEVMDPDDIVIGEAATSPHPAADEDLQAKEAELAAALAELKRA